MVRKLYTGRLTTAMITNFPGPECLHIFGEKIGDIFAGSTFGTGDFAIGLGSLSYNNYFRYGVISRDYILNANDLRDFLQRVDQEFEILGNMISLTGKTEGIDQV